MTTITQIVEYVDRDGIRHRVLLPDGALDPSEGIPQDFPIERYYLHMPLDFQRRVKEAFWAVGLIEAKHFLERGALEKGRAALLSVVQHDMLDLQRYAKEASSL